MILLPDGSIHHDFSFRTSISGKFQKDMIKNKITNSKEYLDKFHTGWKPLKGYMYRYIYFLDKESEKNFTGQFIPFSKIKELDIEMYKGEWLNGANK